MTKAERITQAETQLAQAALALFENARQVDDEYTPSDFIVAALQRPVAELRKAQDA